MYFRLQEPDHEDQQYPANLLHYTMVRSPNQIPHRKCCQHLQHTSGKMYQEHLRHSYSNHQTTVEPEPIIMQQRKKLRRGSIFKCS